ncbi:hypothetical protein [Urinicoccus massiliensis]|nr:hypothetical protein [Urinicoccus massiliensis]
MKNWKKLENKIWDLAGKGRALFFCREDEIYIFFPGGIMYNKT